MTRVMTGVLAAVGLAAGTIGAMGCVENRAVADRAPAESAAASASTAGTPQEASAAGASTGGTTAAADSAPMGGAGTAAAPASSGEGSRSSEFEGRVERVDKGDHLTIAGSESAGRAFQPFKLEPGTEVVKDGRKASASAIEEGDEVRASFTGEGDALRLERIEILRSAAEAGGTAPPQVDDEQEAGGK